MSTHNPHNTSTTDPTPAAASENKHDRHGEEEHHHEGGGHHPHHDPFGSHGRLTEFYSPPKQRQRWGDKQIHPHTNWGDIFFDLFYVAAAYNLSKLLREEPSARGLLYMTALFFPIMGLWSFKMYYDCRYYYGDDIFHRLFEVATLLALASAVLFIRPVAILSDPAQHIDMFGYCLSVTIGNFLMLVRLIEVMVCQHFFKSPKLYPEAFIASRRDSVWVSSSMSFYLVATIYAAVQYYGDNNATSNESVYNNYTDSSSTTTHESSNSTTNASSPESHYRWLATTGYDATSSSTTATVENDTTAWILLGGAMMNAACLSFIVVFWLSWVEDRKKVTIPMNIDYAIHRYGEWTMLMLGESVLSLLVVDLSNEDGYYTTFFTGILSIILLQYLHFRSQPHNPDEHALRRTKNAGASFSMIFQLYSISLVILGTCYKMFLFEFVYKDYSESAHDRKRTLLSLLLSRLLSGGADSAALSLDTDVRQQRIAHFFSGSMTLVWLCMDGLTLCHKGIDANLKRCVCEDEGAATSHKSLRYKVILLVFLRVALIVFIATLSQYLTSPAILAFVGFCGILCQLTLRLIGSFVVPLDEETAEDKTLDRLVNYAHARASRPGAHQ